MGKIKVTARDRAAGERFAESLAADRAAAKALERKKKRLVMQALDRGKKYGEESIGVKTSLAFRESGTVMAYTILVYPQDTSDDARSFFGMPEPPKAYLIIPNVLKSPPQCGEITNIEMIDDAMKVSGEGFILCWGDIVSDGKNKYRTATFQFNGVVGPKFSPLGAESKGADQ